MLIGFGPFEDTYDDESMGAGVLTELDITLVVPWQIGAGVRCAFNGFHCGVFI